MLRIAIALCVGLGLSACAGPRSQSLGDGTTTLTNEEARSAFVESYPRFLSENERLVLVTINRERDWPHEVREYEVTRIATAEEQVCVNVIRRRDPQNLTLDFEDGWTGRVQHDQCFAYNQIAAIRATGETGSDQASDAIGIAIIGIAAPIMWPVWLIGLGL